MMPREPQEEQTNEIAESPTGELEAEVGEIEDIETLKEALAEAKAKAEANLAGWQRAQADFINYKKRSEQEKEEIAKLKTTQEKFNFPSKKPNSIKTIARIVDSELEYKALYKLFSKYVHPSSFSINLGSEALMSEDRLRHTFLAFALTYAVVTFQQIREATVGRVE